MKKGMRYETTGNSKARRGFGMVVCVMLFALYAIADAQQPARSPQVGILVWASASAISDRIDAFRQRLRELGYVEGKNITIESRYAEGKLERLPELAAELVRIKVDVIVTGGTAPASAAKKATATIPIVFSTANDPVRDRLVSSLARPGGNITGLSIMAPDLDGKRLELLKEAFPKITHIAFLLPAGRGEILTEMERTAKALRLKLLSLGLRGPEDLESAFARAKKERVHALITTLSGQIASQRDQVFDFATKNRLPAMYPYESFVEAGGLMSYAPNQVDLWRRAAEFVDKIVKGTKPADLPVEQPKKFEFLMNLKAAKQIGVTIPPNVLQRADRVIR